jgi:hypothetical protein
LLGVAATFNSDPTTRKYVKIVYPTSVRVHVIPEPTIRLRIRSAGVPGGNTNNPTASPPITSPPARETTIFKTGAPQRTRSPASPSSLARLAPPNSMANHNPAIAATTRARETIKRGRFTV